VRIVWGAQSGLSLVEIEFCLRFECANQTSSAHFSLMVCAKAVIVSSLKTWRTQNGCPQSRDHAVDAASVIEFTVRKSQFVHISMLYAEYGKCAAPLNRIQRLRPEENFEH
jgi:hypothetical protein